MFRRPALPLAEIMWRWSFGAAACVLLGLGFVEYLDTLPVSNVDRMLLRTRHPQLLLQAFSHILQGSAFRLMLAAVVLFAALALLWVLVAACGRGATLGPMVETIRERARLLASESGGNGGSRAERESSESTNWRIRSLAGLHFLRAGLALAACAGIVGAMILTGFLSSPAHPHRTTAFFLSLLFALLVWMLWSSLSWFLSVAAIFVVRQGDDTFAAVSAAVDLCREHFGPVMAVGTWFGVAHLVLFVVATSLLTFPLAFAQIVPPGLVLSAVLLFMLAYFAIVDTLYIGRLAGYVAILEAPPTPAAALLPKPVELAASIAHPALYTLPESAWVDQDETILSDHPSMINENTRPLQQPETARMDPHETILSDSAESIRLDRGSDQDARGSKQKR